MVAPHRALADPLRIRLLEGLWAGPRSARELAGWLDTPADRLYYHLKQLQRAGLVEVVEYRELGGGKVERVYARVEVEPPGDDTPPAEVAEFLGQVVQTTRMDITEAYAARERGADRQVMVTRTGVRLSRAHLAELHARFAELAGQARDDPDEDGVWASVLFAFVDLEDRPTDGEESTQ
ncbi:MAG TPA: winged helix-turn-helix domain-containing protein [Pseudonocardiaceae bacterium]|nr:winged helix-turn-helix domain-containing protein [Pseudonocardiaceae bacterium]